MIAPGFYKVNYRVLRLRELIRLRGWRGGFSGYLVTRFKRPDGASWMPGLWSDSECRPEELSQQCWVAMKPHRPKFEQLGYTECGFAKGTKSLNPAIRDSGAIRYLDPTRRYLGLLLYGRVRLRSTGAERGHVTIAFTASFQKGSFSCTNNKKAFDPPSENEVVRIDSCDVTFIHQRFQHLLAQRKETPRGFPDQESLRQWFDARQTATFEERVRRRLFLPMTEQEVAEAKASLAQAASGIFPPARKNSRVLFWLVFIVLVLGLQFIRSHPSRTRHNLIEYHGVNFKMRKPYLTYEDYKDDPDNLDTNELDGIDHVMTSAKIPSSFKDRASFIRAVFDLKFPGYGARSFGEGAQADDGSVIDAESIEIPQRDKERCFVVRAYRGEWNLLDDFVYGTATTTIQRVKLEKQILRYYDGKDNLLREKHL
jgi:hypothetical protein